MKVHAIGAITLVAALFLLARPCLADEQARRQAELEKIDRLVGDHDFRELSALAASYRERDKVTSSGVSTLNHFYLYVSSGVKQKYSGAGCGAGEKKFSEDWLKAMPNDAAANLEYVEYLLGKAFCVRGTGWASSVPKKAWPEYNKYLRMARARLEDAKWIRDSDPQWYATMERVATYQGWDADAFLALVNEGSSRYPTYYTLYDLGMIYFDARWFGGPEQMETFAKGAMAKVDASAHLDAYARVYWYAADNLGIHDLRKDTNIDWELMKQSMDSVAHHYPDPWNFRAFARLSCGTGDLAEAHMFLEMVAPRLMALPWEQALDQGHCDAASLMPAPPAVTAAVSTPPSQTAVSPAVEPKAKPVQTPESLEAGVRKYLTSPTLHILRYHQAGEVKVVDSSNDNDGQMSFRCYEAVADDGGRWMYLFTFSKDGLTLIATSPRTSKTESCRSIVGRFNFFPPKMLRSVDQHAGVANAG